MESDSCHARRTHSFDSPLLSQQQQEPYYPSQPKKWHTKIFSKLQKWRKRHPLLNLLPALILTLCIISISPPEGLTKTSMNLLGVFVGAIFAIITSGYRISIIASITVCILVLSNNLMCKTTDGKNVDCHLCGTQIVSADVNLNKKDIYMCIPITSAFDAAMSGFSSGIAWLIFSAFQIGKAIQITKLGHRVSLVILYHMGNSLLGLGYAICVIELVLSAFIPSNSARGGGIIFPIITSIIESIEMSEFEMQPVYQYINLVGAYANTATSSIFLTSMAGNPLLALKAKEIFGIDFNFSAWFIGCFFVGFVVLLTIPIFSMLYFKPQFEIQQLKHRISSERYDLGKITSKELKLCAVLFVCIILWAGSPIFKISAPIVAFLATVALMLFDVLEWNDILSNTSAWDTFFWLAIFYTLANQLSLLGISSFIGKVLSNLLSSLSPFMSMIILSIIYYYSTYLFSSTTSHIVALSGPFMEAAKFLKVNPLVFTAILGLFSSLAAVLAPYCCGCIAIYASLPYIKPNDWFKAGIFFSIVQILIVFGIGIPFYYLIGWL
ncbi:hypothetical protein BB561_001451 [Smittium simulii]|uniref:Citrate transporter-like domain-containing protein n=1 Tax=Smittium simulii TaxID=133385 RepID=A0A2T9YUN4_9FUNG|nr:hypothetical protein BB561_001451 [Smittium simulii]